MQINAIYTDFEKAFDKVPHQLLLQKLKLYKVDPSIINWFKSFLCFRIQTVRLNGFISESTEVISGIPQSTILGHRSNIIYTFMIYQICAKNLRMYRLFSDDAKFYSDEDSLSSLVYVPNKNVQINGFLG